MSLINEVPTFKIKCILAGGQGVGTFFYRKVHWLHLFEILDVYGPNT